MILITEPEVEPVTLEEAKLFIRVDHDDDDELIDSLIVTARQYAETVTLRAFITQTWTLSLDCFPVDSQLLARPPLQTVDSVEYLDVNKDAGSFDDFDTDLGANLIRPAYNYAWPSTTLYPTNPITITFTCGYGDSSDDVPDAIKTAIKMLVAHWYEHREPFLVGTIGRDVPMAVESILWQYRWFC